MIGSKVGARGSRGGESHLDRALPQFDVVARHSALVNARPENAYEAARSVDLSGSGATKVLFGARSVPRLLTGKGTLPARLDLQAFVDYGFVFLAEDFPREFVLGAVGRFWRPDGGIVRVDRAGWFEFDRPGYAKGALNVKVRATGDAALVSTETRVLCLDGRSRKAFQAYWRVIGPFSGYLRRVLLREIKTSAERRTL